ncbi:Uncharacterized protein pbN1_23960 [Aromatoleum bremense]|nr:Uncharacterized protein pbN1_23960 [Aromatoleum bremense]
MPRRHRILIPGVPLHLIQRGNNRSACFFCEDNFRYYLEQLAEQPRSPDEGRRPESGEARGH